MIARFVPLALLLLGLVACTAERESRAPARPMRVVSLDYCSDQYVLELLPRDRILAVSPDADRPFSYHRARAVGLRQVPARAEDVLVLKPDLVIRAYGGGPDVEQLFARAGVPLLQVGHADDLPGIRRVLIEVAKGLGETAKGERLAARMDERLAALHAGPQRPRALYLTPAGVTAGTGTHVDQLMNAAGLRNFQEQPGWRSLPLERLVYEQPELVVAALFRVSASQADNWGAGRHPIVQTRLAGLPKVAVDGAATSCGGWFTVDAVEAMARASR